MSNFWFGVFIMASLAFLIGVIVYTVQRQEECAARGGTLVQVPMAILEWDCVQRLPRTR